MGLRASAMPKQRLCRCGCGSPLPDGNTLRKAATIECSLKLAKAATAKKERKALSEARKQTRADKARIKTRQQWLKETQIAFNAYIRERDILLPCISCQRHHSGQYHAGHYFSVGSSPALRFNTLNCHKQCQPCNNHLSGNHIAYRLRLEEKIGKANIDWLEGPHEPKKYTIDELKEIKAKFTKMRRELEKERL